MKIERFPVTLNPHNGDGRFDHYQRSLCWRVPLEELKWTNWWRFLPRDEV